MTTTSGHRTARRPSVTDVAKLANVSVGTVSNVLNRPERVAEATRTRVEQAIAALSFVPNASARQLRAGTITTVGAVLLDIRNPFFTDMARGIEDRIALDDRTLMLASSDEDPKREMRYLRLFEEHGVSGLLVVPSTTEIDHLLAIVDRGLDVVLLDSPSPTPRISSVAVDNIEGGKLAAQHLLAMGHEEITFINGPHSIRQCRDRFAGVELAVQEAGRDPAEVITELTISSLDADGGELAISRVLDEQGDAAPSAVFCVNDLVAIGVQRTMRRRGLEMVGHMAIVGYDDIDIASELALPLTSVRQPHHELGYRAADILMTAGTPEHVVFQPQLVVRASSDPASG